MAAPSQPTAAQVRRVLARARRSATLDADEVDVLVRLRGEALDDAATLAVELRDRGLAQAGRPGVVTYSPKVFIPLTRLCRDTCGYCTFATDPASLRRAGEDYFLSIDEVVDIAAAGAAAGCAEALFTLGDRPEVRWSAAAEWLAARGYDSTLDYLRAAAVAVVERTGLLPHLNPGVMSWQEIARLRPVAPSMGLMLETTSTRLFTTPGECHYGSPDKDPAVRLAVLTDAGRHSVPFTTGVLVGIGETSAELADTLLAIKRVGREHRHVQEVIVQNFRAKPDTALRDAADLDHDSHRAVLVAARLVLGPNARVQAPPNLSDPADITGLLNAGVDDFGGVSPVTPDHVNPERPWPAVDVLGRACAEVGLSLRPRLTAHPEYVRDAERWIDPRLHPHVAALADDDGLLRAGVRPRGHRWQEPDDYAGVAGEPGVGRVELAVTIDSVGRADDRRSDFDAVYGDWSAVADRVPPGSRAGRGHSSNALPAAVRDGLRLAARDPGALAQPRHAEAAVALAGCDGEALAELLGLADELRRATVGDTVTYVVNRNINFTNVCYTGCRFCAFAQRETDADAYTLSLPQVGERVDEALAAGATEICMQGGIHPKLPGSAYLDLIGEVKRRPGVHLHAFSPMEIVNAANRSNCSVEQWLRSAHEAGLDSIPGTAAEILDDDVRWVLTKGKLPTEAWIDVVSTAHRVGLPSSSTMMYGHVDAPHHWVGHLRTLREIQVRTGGFTEFVPLPFVHQNAPIYLAGLARPGSTRRDDAAVVALARLMLHPVITNIQVSWVKLGPDVSAQLLGAGANDLGGTLMEETISRMAGSSFGSAMTPGQLQAIAAAAGRPAEQRTTTYGRVASAQQQPTTIG